jgi:hypothetical protein
VSSVEMFEPPGSVCCRLSDVIEERVLPSISLCNTWATTNTLLTGLAQLDKNMFLSSNPYTLQICLVPYADVLLAFHPEIPSSLHSKQCPLKPLFPRLDSALADLQFRILTWKSSVSPWPYMQFTVTATAPHLFCKLNSL